MSISWGANNSTGRSDTGAFKKFKVSPDTVIVVHATKTTARKGNKTTAGQLSEDGAREIREREETSLIRREK